MGEINLRIMIVSVFAGMLFGWGMSELFGFCDPLVYFSAIYVAILSVIILRLVVHLAMKRTFGCMGG